ncbi:MAG: hypothetical protein IKG37_04495 [Solobacterium sp.]|nr:hypothetical protein [Solobacterium sp.]
MNGNLLINIVLVAISAYMLFRIIKLSGRGKKNQKMLKILDQIDDRDAFFQAADCFIATEKDAEFVQKVSVLRLWGDTFYERNEEFHKHLQEINLETLLNPDGKRKGFDSNEDSFFYLYLAIPNRLNYRKAEGLRKLVDEKLAAVREANANTLQQKLYDENKKYYDGTDDRGIPFIKSFLEGEYGGYRYSKQLIGLYKNCEEALLAKVYLEENNREAYDECMKDLENFGKNTRLGIRWLKELGLSYPEETEEAEAEPETAAEETAEKETAE